MPRVDAEVLRSAVCEVLIAEGTRARRLADRAFLADLESRLTHRRLKLPPFPAAARRVQRLLQEDQPRTLVLVEVIASDPGLVSQVLSQASGAVFHTPARQLDHAIALIGLDELWRLAWRSCLGGLSYEVPGYRWAADEVLVHGRVVGELAAWVADQPRGPAYVTGLLHEVGKLLVYQSASPETERALVLRVADQHNAAIGGLVTDSWGFAPEIVRAIAEQRLPVDQASLLVRQVGLAAAAARAAPNPDGTWPASLYLAAEAVEPSPSVDLLMARLDAIRARNRARSSSESATVRSLSRV